MIKNAMPILKRQYSYRGIRLCVHVVVFYSNYNKIGGIEYTQGFDSFIG